MSAVADRIMKRVRGKGRGWVFTPKSFVDFGTRGSVDMALSRLATSGDIRRIGRGLYDYPRKHDKLGALSPDPANVAKALSTQSGDNLGIGHQRHQRAVGRGGGEQARAIDPGSRPGQLCHDRADPGQASGRAQPDAQAQPRTGDRQCA